MSQQLSCGIRLKKEAMEPPTVKLCLECGQKLKALFFLGVIHDGYVCEPCRLYYSIYVRKLAKAY
jgi:hypothetical protein